MIREQVRQTENLTSSSCEAKTIWFVPKEYPITLPHLQMIPDCAEINFCSALKKQNRRCIVVFPCAATSPAVAAAVNICKLHNKDCIAESTLSHKFWLIKMSLGAPQITQPPSPDDTSAGLLATE